MNPDKGRHSAPRRALLALGGAVLIVSPLLAWTDLNGSGRSGWTDWTAISLLAVLTGATAIAASVTGDRIGLFRPDVSMLGAADMFGVGTSVVLAGVLLFDVPAQADPGTGLFVALAAAVTIFSVAGDYSVFRGAPAFPRRGR